MFFFHDPQQYFLPTNSLPHIERNKERNRTHTRTHNKEKKSQNKTKHTVCGSFSFSHFLSPSSSYTWAQSTRRHNFSGATFAYVVYFSEISRKQWKSVTACGSTEMKQQLLLLSKYLYSIYRPTAAHRHCTLHSEFGERKRMNPTRIYPKALAQILLWRCCVPCSVHHAKGCAQPANKKIGWNSHHIFSSLIV